MEVHVLPVGGLQLMPQLTRSFFFLVWESENEGIVFAFKEFLKIGAVAAI